MSSPNEFKFETQYSDNVNLAVKTSMGYLVHPRAGSVFTLSEKKVNELLANGDWIMVKEIPVKNINFEQPPEYDVINKPSHYHKNEIDVHGYLQKHFPKKPNVTVAEGFHMGNVIKYVSRYKEKDGLNDLIKARNNLDELIALEQANGTDH